MVRHQQKHPYSWIEINQLIFVLISFRYLIEVKRSHGKLEIR